MVNASKRRQVWVVTHSQRLADALAAEAAVTPRTVVKRNGATWIDGLNLAGEFDDDHDGNE
jgi:predicted ATPase